MVTGYLSSSYDKIILGLLKDQGSLGFMIFHIRFLQSAIVSVMF